MDIQRVFLGLLFTVLGLVWFATADATRTDALPESVMRTIQEEPPHVAIRFLEQYVKTHPDVAPAYHELAKLYLAQQTPDSRQHAERAIRQAIRLDPDRVAYQLALGDLFWVQGFWSRAEAQYKKIYEMHPDHAEAAYKVGYMTFRNSLKYEGMVHAESGVVMDWSHYASSGREQAINFLEKSIELDARFRDAYYQLGFVCLEDDRPKDLIRVSQQLLKQYPEDKDALLFCGLGYKTMNDYERAHEFYTRALAHMSAEERAVMESVDLIVSKKEKQQLALGEIQTGDGEAHTRFWRARQPLFLTGFNERQIEHYSRIAYANLRFSRPSQGIQGWQTDMGKVYIKFGAPVHRSAQRPSMDGGTSTVRPHIERWFYEGYAISFQNWDGLDGWGFAPTEMYATLLGGANIPTGAAMHLSDDPSPREVFQKAPARFIDPYLDQKYSVPHQVAAFREHDSIRIEVSYALPRSELSIFRRRLIRPASPMVEIDPHEVLMLEDGIFLFDTHWEKVQAQQERRHLRLPSPEATPGSPHRRYILSENGRFLFSTNRLYAAPGTYHLIAEARDNTSGTIGTFRTLRDFSFGDQTLSMSDLLVASRIDPLIAFPEGREDLEIIPNPIRTFSQSDFVYVYFEMYNLQRDAFGRTAYEISYQIGRPEAREIDPALFVARRYRDNRPEMAVQAMTGEEAEAAGEVLAARGSVAYRVRYLLPDRSDVLDTGEMQGLERTEEGGTRMVTVEYEGMQPDDFTYLQIDVGQVPPGIHQLTVTVADHHRKERSQRTVLFRLME